MLAIMRNAQKRETQASLPCEKNTLLAITILLSAAQPFFTSDDALLLRFLGELQECLTSSSTSKVAAGCYRTLIMQGISPRVTFGHALKFLHDAPDLEGMDETKAVIAQTLTAYTMRLTPEQKPAAVTLVANTLLNLASKDGPSSHQGIAARLLELAATDSATFRGIVASMAGHRKQLTEQILKSQAGNRGARPDSSNDREPTIALKMNFGG
jgi:hypothetical protein